MPILVCFLPIHIQALPVAEKRATVIQLVDAWRSTKSTDAAAARSARAMTKEDCEEVRIAALVCERQTVCISGETSLSVSLHCLDYTEI